MTDDGNRVEIIVVSYFGARDLLGLLESLRRQSHEGWRMRLVDNSDDPEEHERLRTVTVLEPRVSLIRAEKNLGYFGAARLALERVDTESARAVIVSNTDIVLPEQGTLARIAEAAAAEARDVAVLAPRILSQRDGRDQNPHLVARPDPSIQERRMRRMASPALAQFTLLASVLVRRLRRGGPQSDDARDVYASHGAFMIFTRSYFRNGGDLAHPIFLFAEELTVAEKTRTIGCRIRYRPDLEVRHVEHGQMGFLRSRRVLREMVAASRYGYELIARSPAGPEG